MYISSSNKELSFLQFTQRYCSSLVKRMQDTNAHSREYICILKLDLFPESSHAHLLLVFETN